MFNKLVLKKDDNEKVTTQQYIDSYRFKFRYADKEGDENQEGRNELIPIITYYEIIIKNSDGNRRITIINKRLRTNQECENRNRKDLRQLWYVQNHHRKSR
jgi:hypothetical protein